MAAKKLLTIGKIVLFLFAGAMFVNYAWCSLQLKNSLRVLESIESGVYDDLSLAIYCFNPGYFLLIPITTTDDLISGYCDYIAVISADDLMEHLGAFKQLKKADLAPVLWKSAYVDLRVCYVLKSVKNGTLLEVAMFPGDSTFVNGIEVRENDYLYDLILPFLPEEGGIEWPAFTNRKK